MEKIRVILYGVGAVGSRIAKTLLQKEGVDIVGAVDTAKNKVGKDLGAALGIDKQLGVVISDEPRGVFGKVKADVIIHATTSFLRQAYPQIVEALEHNLNVVSTCEELSYPYRADSDLARRLHERANENGCTVLGTGINPGFLMDTLVITLTAVCQQIEEVRVERVMNAATRRVPFQKKIGAGLTFKEFRNRMQSGAMTGHIGLEQSILMIASALRWELDRIQVEMVEPIAAERIVSSEAIRVEPGEVAGLQQRAMGISKGKELIKLEFQAYIGAEEEYDSITIEGVPNIHQKITPCVHGDVGTVAVVINSIPKVLNAPPGLYTMKDLPIPSAALEDMRKYVDR